MNAPLSIADLFARLALHLQSPSYQEEEEESRALDVSILHLNQSLNLQGNPNSDCGFRVLDAALSLMCFKAPQVFEKTIEYQVKTIISVLSSSVDCKVWRVQNEEFFLIGSSVPRSSYMELLKMCENLLEKSEGHGVLPNLLLDAAVRWAVSSSRFKHLYPLTSVIDVKSSERSPAVSNLYCHLHKNLPLENQDILLRLFFWYLDPLTLRQTVSEVLQDTIRRPFLCLSDEFNQRADWRAFITCLALSPVMFSETRALLHCWFLTTGFASILDLVVEIVTAILDIISIPTSWGLTFEYGSKLPFSSLYFPSNGHLVRLLAGLPSSENFLNLVDATCGQVSHGRKQFHQAIKPNTMEVTKTDHSSLWALAIDFPDCFYFASFSLFSGSGNSGVSEMNDKKSLSTAAARYIAWILSPISKSNQDLLVECLTKISESWILELFDLRPHNQETVCSRRKLKKLKIQDKDEISARTKAYDSDKMRSWLRKIQNMYEKRIDVLSLQKNVLLRRILLGIVIRFPSYTTEDGCELLLHYVATGIILQPSKTMTAGKTEASAGVCLVFSLTDIVESISGSFSATEENAQDFVYQVKVKCGKYLIKSVNRLIELYVQEDGDFMLQDLLSRLARWRHQTKEVLSIQNDINDVTDVLKNTLSCNSEDSRVNYC